MTLSDAAPIAVGLLALLGALWQGRRPRPDPRDRLKRDLELLAAMPDDLQVKSDYKQYISDAFTSLIEDELRLARNMRGVRFDLALVVVGASFVWLGWTQAGGWRGTLADLAEKRSPWWMYFAFLSLSLIWTGLADFPKDLRKCHRDENGRIIVRESMPEAD